MGNEHTLALKIDGTLWAWGDNQFGQLGDGTTNYRAAPVMIEGNDWRTVATSARHTLALKCDGSMWAWGDNRFGQLGIGASGGGEMVTVPTRVGADNDWAEVAVSDRYWFDGLGHSVALKTDGSVWEWGATWGFENVISPSRVGSANDWVAIDTAARLRVGLRSDGSAWRWGVGDDGFNIPARIGTDNDWALVAAGEQYCLLLKRDGTIWEWPPAISAPDPVCIDTGTDWIWVDTKSVEPVGQTPRDYLDLGIKRDGSLWLRHRRSCIWNFPTNFVRVNANVQAAVPGRIRHAGIACFDFSSYAAIALDGTLLVTQISATEQDVVQFQTNRISDDIDWGSSWSLPLSNELRVVRHALGSDARFRTVVGPLSNDCYSILYRGPSVTNISQPVDLRSVPFARALQLTDPTPATIDGSGFYRVQQMPIAQPLDSAGDGDGKSNLKEYRDGTDPEMP